MIKLKKLLKEGIGKEKLLFVVDGKAHRKTPTLWSSFSPNSGHTKPIRNLNSFMTDKSGDNHYDYIVKDITDWMSRNKALAHKGDRYLYKIPTYDSNQMVQHDHNDLDIWGGEIKPVFYYWMVVIKESDYHLVNFFEKKNEAMYWLKGDM